MNFRKSTALGAMFLFAVCCASVLMVRAASADVIQATYNQFGYAYDVAHIPDLDQRRMTVYEPSFVLGLPQPGNGSMYCAPTSALDVVTYIANHGFPEVMPGPDNWWDPDTYYKATTNISKMGSFMGTSPQDGTTGEGVDKGLHEWLDPYNKFVIDEYYCNANHCPTLPVLASAGISGAMVFFAYGRYDHQYFVDDLPNYIHVGERTGGHVVVLAKAAGTWVGSNLQLEVRDPNSSDSQTVQSPFANKAYDVSEIEVIKSNEFDRKMTLLNFAPVSSVVAAIDGATVVRLKSGYSLVNGAHSLLHIKPYQLSQDNCCLGKHHQIDLSSGKTIISFALHPDGIGAIAVVDNGAGQPRTLERISAITGESEPILEVGDGIAMTLARNRNAYVVRTDPTTGQKIVESIDIDFPPDPVAPLVPSASIVLPYDAQAIASDNAQDQVVMLSTRDHKLMRTDLKLTMTPAVMDIPPSIPLGGHPQVAISPADGKVWILSDAYNGLFGLSQDSSGNEVVETLIHPAISHPAGFDFDDAGHLFISNDGVVVEMARDADGNWQVVPDSAYADYSSEGMLRIARSSTNYDPDYNDYPPPYNLEQDQIVAGTEILDKDAGPDHVYDLAVDSLTATPDVPTVGQSVTLEATIRNTGTESVTDFKVDLYKDLGNSPPVVGQVGDVMTCTIISLDPGATTTCSGTVSYGATGTYIAWAQVDTQDTVPEADESTNNTASLGVAVRLPDLRFTELTVPTANVTVGEAVPISATITNVGAADALNFTTDLYKNGGSAPDPSLAGDFICPTVSVLHSGDSTTCSTTVSYTSTGTHNVWARVDRTDTVMESNENNDVAGPVPVTVVVPDLYISSLNVYPSRTRVREATTIVAVVRNTLAYDITTPFTVDLYKHSGTAPSASTVGNITCTVPKLAAGDAYTCQGDVIYYSTGYRKAWARVDRTNAIVESKEGNNVKGPVRVTVR